MDDLINRPLAIEALQNERQRLIEFMDFCLKTEMYATHYGTKMAIDRIDADIFILEELPNTELKKGKWIICSDGYYPYCSECNHRPHEMTNYCPNCGAKMEKEDNESDNT